MSLTEAQIVRAYAIRASIDGVLPVIADDTAKVNEAVNLIKPWKPGTMESPIVYTAKTDLRTHNGIPYRCAQTHTHHGEADWEPGAAPSLWVQYHGTSLETARPFVQPTGAHDVYRLGEYTIWTDDQVYTPATDNMAYSPGDYPQGWTLVAV